MSKTKKNILAIIALIFTALSLIGSVLFHGGQMDQEIKNLRRADSSLSKRIESVETRNSALFNMIGNIKEDVGWIRGALEKERNK